MNHTPSELKQLRHQQELLKEVIGPAIHLTGLLPDGTIKEYFEDRDNTVEDATQLAKMCISLMVSMSPSDADCDYFHTLEVFYEQAIGSDLN